MVCYNGHSPDPESHADHRAQLPSHGLLYTSLLAVWSCLLQSSTAQFPPPITSDTNLTTIKSPIDDNITIVYKSPPPGTCTTIFPNQRQYTGHVIIPPSTLTSVQQDYAINTFFWFIEARESPEKAPLTVWLNGGPGSSSMVGLFQESGPCEVVELAKGRFGTQARDWGWDRSSNMLYVDQPNKVGYSFDKLTNGTLDLLTGNLVSPPQSTPPTSQPDYTFLNGTFSSTNANTTTNTTEIAAQAIWHMLQGFLGTFPQYNPGNRPDINMTGSVGINLFTESYGGKFGPAFASFWQKQNNARGNGSVPSTALEIELRSLGIINGCVDDLIQVPSYPMMAYNNTYGIKAISQVDYLNSMDSFAGAGGCKEAIQACRAAESTLDADSEGDVPSVNDLCHKAQESCNQIITNPFAGSGRSVYDIAHSNPDPFPPSTYLEYLNTDAVLAAIGSPLNYSETSGYVQNAFATTGDWERGDQIAQLSNLLANNVRVAFIYGDRDYICNWIGGEAVSFAVAGSLPGTYTPAFHAAGYANIVINDSYVGGQVRQYGNLSFSRIYDAGHLVPAYQPETAFTVFTRVVTGVDIATGKAVDLASFGSKGDANSTATASPPAAPDPTCWVRNIANTCDKDATDMIRHDDGVVINGVLYRDDGDWRPPRGSVTSEAGVPGTFPTVSSSKAGKGSSGGEATETATGVYVATGQPTATKKAAAGRARQCDWALLGVGLVGACVASGLL